MLVGTGRDVHLVRFGVIDLDVCVDQLGVVMVRHLELLDCAHT